MVHQIGEVGNKLPTSLVVGNHPDYQPLEKIMERLVKYFAFLTLPTSIPLHNKNEQQRLVMSKISEKLLPTSGTNWPLRAV